MEERFGKYSIAALCASIISVISILILPKHIEKNLIIYIVGLVIYALIFVMAYILSKENERADTKKFAFSLCVFVGVSVLMVDYVMKITPFYGYEGWTLIPQWIVLGGICVTCAFNSYLLLKTENYKLTLFYIVAIFLYAISRYNPNILNADVYDADAYLYSIYNVYHGVPFNIDTTGIYGHYAIFYKIPMMIFGGSVVNISVMIAITAAIAMMAYIYAVNNLIKNSFLKILIVLAVLLEPLYALPYSYYQTSPNRYLFPALIMALMAFDMKKQKFSNRILGIILCSCSFLWNLESGVVVSIAWFIYSEINHLQKRKKIFDKDLFINAIFIPVELAISLLVYSMYNILCGGSPSIKAFFYPYNHHIEDFSLPIECGNYAYIWVIPIFMCMFFWGIISIRTFGRENRNAAVIASVSTIGIGYFSYYMNRFAKCNVWMIVWELVLVLGIVIDGSGKEIMDIFIQKKCTLYKGLKMVLIYIGVTIISTLAVGNIFSAERQIKLYQEGTKDIKILKSWSEEVEKSVPKDTYACGLGAWSIYSMLDWDTGYHINDLPNLVARPEACAQFFEEIYEKDELFIAEDLINIEELCSKGRYTIKSEFLFGNRKYYYLKKEEL